MKRGFRRFGLIAMVLVGVGVLASALLAQGGVTASSGQQQASTQGSPAKAARMPFTKRLVRDLKKDDFRVHSGYPFVFGQGSCPYLYRALQDCFGNNPAGAYVIPVVKAWPNEHVGPTPPNAFGPLRRGYIPTWRLGPRDALVLYGKMPPPAKFMGPMTVDWSQHGHWKAKDYNKWKYAPKSRQPYPMEYLFSTIPPNDPNAGRTWTFSSLGDGINNVVMQRQSGSPWGKNRYFITTPSAATDDAVRRALQARGIRNRDIFTEKIPSRDHLGPIGPLGMGKDAIDFWNFFRYALPDPGYQAAAQRWVADPPLTVMRVRAPSSLGPVRRYGMLRYGKRTGHNEAYLAGDLQNLVKAVCERARSTVNLESADCAQPPPASSFMPSPVGDFERAPYCRKINMWCGGQSDAALYWTRPLPLDSGQAYAVVDTLATETRNATYVGLGVNDASTFLAPAGTTDAFLKGSANAYAATVNYTGKLFVHYFARNCDTLGKLLDRPQDCTQITDQMVPPEGDTTAPGDPALKGMFWPSIRDYIAPGSARGPAYSKLLRPRILAFNKP